MSRKAKEFFAAITAKDFPPIPSSKNDGKVFQLNCTDKVRSAMRALSEMDIHSAPVWDPQQNSYVGMIDVVDIVEFVIQTFEKSDIVGEEFVSMMEQVERFASACVSQVVDLSHRDPFVPLSDNADLLNIVQILGKYGVHRVNIFDEAGNLINIITQLAVLQLISSHLDSISDIGGLTLEQLNIGTSPVTTINLSSPTIDAFRVIRDRRLYAVPVIDAEGKIVGNVSAKDMRFVVKSPAHMYLLHEPISKLLANLHNDDIDERIPAIACFASDSLELVIRKLSANKIHRIYVVDSNNQLQRVVTLTDILFALIK